MELAKLLKSINENYENYDVRYILVLQTLIEAKKLNYKAGFRYDSSEPDWPVVVIELPELGQVSWHMPPSKIEYDNSSPKDCQERCEKFYSFYLGN